MKTYYVFVSIFIAIALFSCNQKDKDAHEHAHSDNLHLTSYNSSFEVFAEAEPLVKGHESEILAHITWLSNFKPLEDGSVTASLIIGSEQVEQTVVKPLQPGIFKFVLKPEQEGDASLVLKINSVKETSTISIDGLKVYANAEDAMHAAESEVIEGINTAVFTKEQSWKIDFSTEIVERERFGQIIRTVGQIQPSVGDERVISAKTGGIVLFSGNNLVDGNAVRAGETLFTIDGSEMSDNNLSVRQAETQHEYNRAKAEYERKAALAKDRIVSESDLLYAKTELENARANYTNLQKNFSLGKQAVSSPISGFVKNVLVSNGEFAESGQPVLTVSQNKNLFVKADIRPRYFQELNTISTVVFRTMANKTSYALEDLNGKIVSFGKSADLSNPLIPVVFQIDNRAGFVSGGFIEMFIKTQSQTEALTVANDAIVEEMGNFFVYVQLTPELFEKRPVKTAETDGKRTKITEGLLQGERVISKGAILVKLAQAAGALDPHAGHVH